MAEALVAGACFRKPRMGQQGQRVEVPAAGTHMELVHTAVAEHTGCEAVATEPRLLQRRLVAAFRIAPEEARRTDHPGVDAVEEACQTDFRELEEVAGVAYQTGCPHPEEAFHTGCPHRWAGAELAAEEAFRSGYPHRLAGAALAAEEAFHIGYQHRWAGAVLAVEAAFHTGSQRRLEVAAYAFHTGCQHLVAGACRIAAGSRHPYPAPAGALPMGHWWQAGVDHSRNYRRGSLSQHPQQGPAEGDFLEKEVAAAVAAVPLEEVRTDRMGST